VRVANESITTVEDGPETVNERLSPGGPGPEGQPDTAEEHLSGEAVAAPVVAEDSEPVAPRKSARKKT
jgi:hypothetical protein